MFVCLFNSKSISARKATNIMVCLFSRYMFWYKVCLGARTGIVIVVQFSIELRSFHESCFHHLHLLWLHLLLHAVKFHLDQNHLKGHVCHFAQFYLNHILFWLWHINACMPAGPWGPSPSGASPRSLSPAAVTPTHWCFSHQPALPTSLQSGKNDRHREWEKEGRKGGCKERLGQSEKIFKSTAREESLEESRYPPCFPVDRCWVSTHSAPFPPSLTSVYAAGSLPRTQHVSL